MKKSTVREIYSLDVLENGEELDIVVCGNGFLYNMVRIISGTLFKVGTGEIKPEEIKNIIKDKNRENAGDTLSPSGLTLLSVEY
jgi:tRNA pseudouridine38-40 synthase